jgi:transposase
MIDQWIREAILKWHAEGLSMRKIARRLMVDRKTVRSVIQNGETLPIVERPEKIDIDSDLLAELYAKCRGVGYRVYEELNETHKIEVGYSTVNRLLREQGMTRKRRQRCDSRGDEPGAEMQHDTSPYRIKLGKAIVQVVASLLYLRYSKRRYLRFYRAFDRFRMKCFLHEALSFWGYSAPCCVIDNTNLARWRGTGKQALIVPEMEAFARMYAFEFLCHEKGHANRKAGEERSFYTVETNFFPGRSFQDMADLNAQAFSWATERLEKRKQTKAGIVPAEAFEYEMPFLQKLPSHLPEPCREHPREVDQYGYAAFNGNYYWVPGEDRYPVRLDEYAHHVKVCRGRECLARYALPPEGVRLERIAPPDKPTPYRPRRQSPPADEERRRLCAMDPALSAWLDFCLEGKGVRRHQFTRALYALSRRMTPELFVRAVKRALRYGVRSLDTLERIASIYTTAEQGSFPDADWAPDFRSREAYRDGCLSETPDLSDYVQDEDTPTLDTDEKHRQNTEEETTDGQDLG